MERPPDENTETNRETGQPGETFASPLSPEFSDHEIHEPEQVRYRNEWPESIPKIFPFVEQRHGDRRHRYKRVTEDRRRPEAGDRRQLPLMRPLPGFHVNGDPQHDYHESVLLGSIPSIRERIFVDQHYVQDAPMLDNDDEMPAERDV